MGVSKLTPAGPQYACVLLYLSAGENVVCDSTGAPVGHKQQWWKLQYSADPGVLVRSITTEVGQDPGNDSDTGEAQFETWCHSVLTSWTAMADSAFKLGALGLISQPGLA